jgi:hypothetical protein
VNKSPVLGLNDIDAIFDTGTTLIIGDPAGIMDFFAPLVLSFGAEPVPKFPGYYSSTWANLAADQPSQQYLNFLLISQSHATSILPSPFMLEGRKSRFPVIRLSSGPYPMALDDALLEQPRMTNSLVVSWPLMTILGTKLTWIQNSGFSATSSCRTLTLLGILAIAVSALLILLESRNYSRSRRSSGSLDFVTYVRKKDHTTNSEMRLEKYQGRLGLHKMIVL